MSGRARVQFGPCRVLDTVDRPEDLPQTGQFHLFARAAPWVIGGKAAVVGGVPILRGHYEVELRLDTVDYRNNPVPLRDC